MKPALAAFGVRTAVPGDTKRLQSPAGKFDQVLLQRRDSKCVSDLELGELAVGTVGADSELVIALGEGAGNVAVSEFRVSEIAQHGIRVCRLHRQLVRRASPRLVFFCMTLGAGLAADVLSGGRRILPATHRRVLQRMEPQPCETYGGYENGATVPERHPAASLFSDRSFRVRFRLRHAVPVR